MPACADDRSGPALPLVSIVINNHNYGRFIHDAIDSALHQLYPTIEVIVVDDGSTDDSRDVIASYGNRIVAVLKECGGQASALNAGFALSHGDIVIFLDADDVLLPRTVERVAYTFRSNPRLAKVSYRLAVVDTSGMPTGAVTPSRSARMPQGDMRNQVLNCPDDIPWPETSGNAFSAAVLREVMPVPEDVYPICADYYLSNVSALFLPVVSLEQAGGYHRRHGSNLHTVKGLDLEQTRRIISLTIATHAYIELFVKRLGLTWTRARPYRLLSVSFVAHRLISLRLDPSHHPISDDTALRLLWQGLIAGMLHSQSSFAKRMLYVAWVMLVAVIPKPMVRVMGDAFFNHQ